MIDPEVLRETIAELGQPPYRAAQVYRALARGLATEFAAIGVLPRDLRTALAERLQPLSLTPVETRVTPTGSPFLSRTRKLCHACVIFWI